jgi:Flp pilus assembly protein TadD
MIRLQNGNSVMLALAASLLSMVAIATLGSPAALAVDTISSKDAPDLTAARAKIKAKDYQAALVELRTLADTNQHADVYSLLGFSLRQTGDYTTALTFYKKALDFDANHKGAHEYLGELYLKTGEMDKAKAMLAKLEKLCPTGCEELADLKGDIAEAEAKSAAKTN